MIKNTLLLSQSSRPDPVVRAKTAKAGQIFFSTNTQDKEIASGLMERLLECIEYKDFNLSTDGDNKRGLTYQLLEQFSTSNWRDMLIEKLVDLLTRGHSTTSGLYIRLYQEFNNSLFGVYESHKRDFPKNILEGFRQPKAIDAINNYVIFTILAQPLANEFKIEDNKDNEAIVDNLFQSLADSARFTSLISECLRMLWRGYYDFNSQRGLSPRQREIAYRILMTTDELYCLTSIIQVIGCEYDNNTSIIRNWAEAADTGFLQQEPPTSSPPPPQNILDRLKTLLKHEDELIHVPAVLALVRMNCFYPEMLPLLFAIMTDSTYWTVSRDDCVLGLVLFAEQFSVHTTIITTFVEQLDANFRGVDEYVCERSMFALIALNDRRMIGYLERVFVSGSEDAKVYAAASLAVMSKDNNSEAIMLLKKAQETTRSENAQAEIKRVLSLSSVYQNEEQR